MELNLSDLNKATFVGIDAHREEHTAMAINRFEEEKGRLTFANTKDGIREFILWLGVFPNSLVGIEGGGTTRNTLIQSILEKFGQVRVFEVNPLYTKQRRDYGTKGNKSDILDAKLVAEVLTKKLTDLPEMTKESFSPNLIALQKLVRFYEEVTIQGARIKNQLKDLGKQERLVKGKSQTITLTFILREKRKELGRIELLKKNLEEKFKILLETQGKNLTTLKGISTVLAAKIVAHTRGVDRFSNIDKFIKYAGIAPLENSSGKLKKHTKNTKGNRCLNTTLYLVALNQLRWNQKARDYFEKKIKEGKTRKQALRCLTKRVACIVYGMLKSKEDYRG